MDAELDVCGFHHKARSLMCGRFTLTSPAEALQDFFDLVDGTSDVLPRFNISPTQRVAVVPNRAERRVEHFRWGLIPPWAKDETIGNRMINARAETIAEKPSFKRALLARRCLVLADGFFEWRRQGDAKVKTPIYVRMRSGEPFAFAGLWETWKGPDGDVVPSCTIITTGPNDLMKTIHHRMPVILARDTYDVWLAPERGAQPALCDLLLPFSADEMEAYPVSRWVNNPKNDGPRCIEPANEGLLLLTI